MTRQQAKVNLIAIGIAEPTEQQISDYLNQVNGETKNANDRADKYKQEADKTAELQKQLDDLNSQNLTDIEKANKATEQANEQVAKLQKDIARMEQKNKLAEMGIVGEQADKLIGENGLDFAVLGQILSDRETAAANAKLQEIANNSTNPGGGTAGSGENEKSLAEQMVSKLYGNQKQDNSILNNYLVGGN